MQYCESGDLERVARQHHKDRTVMHPGNVMDIAAQLLSAVEHVHANKMIHRDIKPANIFLRNSGKTVVLGDFGVARQLEHTLEAARTYAGTVVYMAPEVLAHKDYSTAADVWSLGVTLFELMTGTRPFRGDTAPELTRCILHHDPIPKLREWGSHYPVAFVDMVAAMLLKDPHGRPTAADLLSGLAALLGAESPARPATPVRDATPLGRDVPAAAREVAQERPATPVRGATPLARDVSPVREAPLFPRSRPRSPVHAAVVPQPVSPLQQATDALSRETLRNVLLLKARRMASTTPCGKQLRDALGSDRVFALVEAAAALYSQPNSGAVEAAEAIIAAFRPADVQQLCAPLVRALYSTR
jgi:serine/threonine protein kinase